MDECALTRDLDVEREGVALLSESFLNKGFIVDEDEIARYKFGDDIVPLTVVIMAPDETAGFDFSLAVDAKSATDDTIFACKGYLDVTIGSVCSDVGDSAMFFIRELKMARFSFLVRRSEREDFEIIIGHSDVASLPVAAEDISGTSKLEVSAVNVAVNLEGTFVRRLGDDEASIIRVDLQVEHLTALYEA